MQRFGMVSLARSVELTAQWDRILAVGPLYPVTVDDLSAVQGLGVGDFHRVVSGIHHRLSDIIHSVVVHRRDEAIRWRNWLREDPSVRPYKWRRPDLIPPAPFLQCQPHRTPGGSGVLADPARIDEEFRKTWRSRQLKVLPVAWYDELARILSAVEDTGVRPDGMQIILSVYLGTLICS